MKTIIVGRSSNLSAGLASALPDAVLVSARRLASADVGRELPREPFVLVMNQFQPSGSLNDLASPTSYLQLAVTITAKLLEGIEHHDCRKIIYTSSAAVYGDDIACTEESIPRATNLHAALKASNEYLVSGFCADRGLDYTVVRLFNLYGGQDNFSIIARILAAVRKKQPLVLMNQGNAIRDFIHIDDVVTCYRALLDCRDLPFINVATGEGTSVRSIVDAVRLRGYTLQTTSVRGSEIRVSTADVTRLSHITDTDGFIRVIDHVLAELA
jgi:nucleoside-diphosphate-sugar epimerase